MCSGVGEASVGELLGSVARSLAGLPEERLGGASGEPAWRPTCPTTKCLGHESRNVIIPNALLKRKFHSCFKHWINSILEYGSPFLYSGEANEEFHKVACKVQIKLRRVHR